MMKCPLCRKPKGCQQLHHDQYSRDELLGVINRFRHQEQTLLLAYQNYVVHPIRQDDSDLIEALPIIHQDEWNYISSDISNEQLFNYLQNRPHFGYNIRDRLLEVINMHRRDEMLASERSLGRPLSDEERSVMENEMQTELAHISDLSYYGLFVYLQTIVRVRNLQIN